MTRTQKFGLGWILVAFLLATYLVFGGEPLENGRFFAVCILAVMAAFPSYLFQILEGLARHFKTTQGKS